MMKNRDLSEKAAGLLRNDLSPGEEEKIIKALEKDGMNRDEIDSLRNLSADLDDVFRSEPGGRMDSNFYAMLENESKGNMLNEKEAIRRSITQRYSWMWAAAGIALFLLGWFSASWFGNSSVSDDQLTGLSGEVRELKETLILTMMDQSSTVERIKAVNMVGEFETANDRIIENLFKVLNTDSNDNVRLLALEALIKYSGETGVREGLISSISRQTSPMIQLRMTEIMVALNEKRAADEFRKLLNDVNLNYSVRNRIQEAVGTLL
jgi:hypothetical protein